MTTRPWHQNVQNDEVRVVAIHHLQGLSTVFRLQQFEPEAFKIERKNLPKVGVIVGYEDSWSSTLYHRVLGPGNA